MSSADGEKKALIETVSREALEKAIGEGELISIPEKDALEKKGLSELKKTPVGCVELVLDMIDRHLLVVAARRYCIQDGHKTQKDAKNLERLLKLVVWDEVQDYHITVDDSHEDEMIRWQGEKEIYKTWRGYKSGAVTRKQIEDNYPDFDFELEPPKPALRSPDISDKDRQGSESMFEIPSKLYAWIVTVLEKAEWDAAKDWQVRLGLRLQEKFGIKDE